MTVTNVSQNNFPLALQTQPQEVSKKDLACCAASVALLSFCTTMTFRYARQQGMQNLSKFSTLLPETCWPHIQKRAMDALSRQMIPSGPTIMGHINPSLLLPETSWSYIQKRAMDALSRQTIPSGPTIMGHINPSLLLPETSRSYIQERSLDVISKQNIPSGPTIEGYPSYVRLNYRSGNEVIKAAHDLMKSDFSKKEKMQRIQELPLRQFGVDPEFFLSRLRKSQYR